MYKFIIIVFVLIIGTCFTITFDAYRCDFVAEHLDYMNLKGCDYVSSSNFSCTLYANATDITTLFPVSAVIEFTQEFSVIKKSRIKFKDSNVTEDWWCLSMTSMRFKKIMEQPSDAQNVYKLPSASAGLLSTVIEGSGHFEFYAPVVAAFAQINDSCIQDNSIVRNDCIYRFRGVKMIAAPLSFSDNTVHTNVSFENENSSYNFTTESFKNLELRKGIHEKYLWDFFQRQLLRFYVALMQGILRTFTLSTSLQGPFAADWVPYLRGTNVKILNASNNNFNDLTMKSLMKMTRLTHLYLSNCKINISNAVNFLKTPALEELDLSDNMFDAPPVQIHIKNISSLNLGVKKNKPATFILNRELGYMISLKILNLTGLPLTDIKAYALPTTLEVLDITDCELSTLRLDTFAKLTNLIEFYAAYNKITTLPSNVFSNIAKNAKIFLSYNQINTSNNLNLNALEILDLSFNKLNKTDNILISKGNIITLDISGNRIRYWTSNDLFFNNSTKIINLNISNNEIASIDKNMAKSLNSLNTVDIGGNIFDCQDCALLEFQTWLNKTTVNILMLGNYNATILCSAPARQKGLPLLNQPYNVTECVIYPPNMLLVAVLPACTIFIVATAIILAFYIYRFEITYIRHLLKVRRRNAVESRERDGCKYDVFVSYCSKDRDWVLRDLLPALENHEDRYTLCLHERDFKLGSFILDNIVDCIQQSRRVILVLSNNFINSQWCKTELQLAQLRILFENNLTFVILVELERLERECVPAHLRMLMDTRTYLEWSGGHETQNFWRRLKEALGTPIELSRNSDLDVMSEDEYLEQPLVPFQPLRI